MSDTRNHTTRDQHPEDYCHRCEGPNISWYTPGGTWDPVMRPDGETGKWNEIICPLCFVELAGGGSWALIPMKDDGQRWTSADERAAVRAAAVAETTAAIEALLRQVEDDARENQHLARLSTREVRAALSGGRTALDTCGHPNHHGPDHDCTPFRADTGAAESSTCTCGDPIAGPICHHVFPPAEEQPR